MVAESRQQTLEPTESLPAQRNSAGVLGLPTERGDGAGPKGEQTGFVLSCLVYACRMMQLLDM